VTFPKRACLHSLIYREQNSISIATSHWVNTPRSIEDILRRRKCNGNSDNGTRPPPSPPAKSRVEQYQQRIHERKGNIRPPPASRNHQREAELQRKTKQNGTRPPPPPANRKQQRQAHGQGKQSSSSPARIPSYAQRFPVKLEHGQGMSKGGTRPRIIDRQREAGRDIKENTFTSLPKPVFEPARESAPPSPANRIQTRQ
jgi:hypothetical protein